MGDDLYHVHPPGAEVCAAPFLFACLSVLVPYIGVILAALPAILVGLFQWGIGAQIVARIKTASQRAVPEEKPGG